MADGAAATGSKEDLDRLGTVLIAKDLFLSPWYESAAEHLRFDGETRRLLETVRQETWDETHRLAKAMTDWAARSPDDAAGSEVARLSRIEFLEVLIEAKESAGKALEKASANAPPGLQSRLSDLAAVDFRHAEAMRERLRLLLRSGR